MALCSFVVKRHNRYYFRTRLPVDIAAGVGRTHVVMALGTADPRVAKISASRFYFVVSELLHIIRLRMRDARSIDETGQQDELLAFGAFALGREYQNKAESLRQEFDARLRELVSGFRGQPSQLWAGETPLWGSSIPIERQNIGVIEGVAAGQSIQATPGWDTLRDRFFKDKPGLTAKTKWSYNQAFDIWRGLIGNMPIGDIRRADVKAFADHIRERPNLRGGLLNHKTIGRHLGNIKTFLGWAVSAGLAFDDRFDYVTARGKTADEKLAGPPRRAFTTAEMEELFKSSLFIGRRSREEIADGWFFALSILTGARTEELALAPARLVRVGEIDCLDLREVGRKTSAAPRMVPLLPDLLKMGLQAWAKEQVERGYKLVQAGSKQRTAAGWSKRLNRFLNRTISKDSELVLYSARHSFRQMLRAANIGDELANKIFGHSSGNVGAGYGRELGPQEAELVVKSVRSPVDLSHLWRSS